MSKTPSRLFLFLPLVLLGLTLVLAACTPRTSPPAGQTVAPTVLSESAYPEFVGDAACQPCHASEFASHSKTNHHKTLREATITDLGELAPQPADVGGGITFSVEQDRLQVTAPAPHGAGRQQLPLSFALGVGKTGMTFLALLAEGTQGSVEINPSYFPKQKAWHTTPGQPDFHQGQVGHVNSESETRQCMSCHTVTMPLVSNVPERRFFGVGCESCHGMGSKHVALMTQKKTGDTGLPALYKMGGKEINTLCGRCHRTAVEVSHMAKNAQNDTHRFQPFGLSLSKCFIKSKNTLTCITCHNPHEDAQTDSKSYEPACLSCHSGKSADKKACPVNPKDKCIGCHMPTRPVFPGSLLPNAMADHFIRIYKNLR
jgi:hypothetical protein